MAEKKEPLLLLDNSTMYVIGAGDYHSTNLTFEEAIRKMRVGQDAIAVKRYITPSETQPEVEATDGVLAKKIQNVYVYCQYITRVS